MQQGAPAGATAHLVKAGYLGRELRSEKGRERCVHKGRSAQQTQQQCGKQGRKPVQTKSREEDALLMGWRGWRVPAGRQLCSQPAPCLQRGGSAHVKRVVLLCRGGIPHKVFQQLLLLPPPAAAVGSAAAAAGSAAATAASCRHRRRIRRRLTGLRHNCPHLHSAHSRQAGSTTAHHIVFYTYGNLSACSAVWASACIADM